MHLQSLSLLYKGPYIQILWNRLWTSCGGEGRFSTYHRGLNLNLIFYLTCHNEAWLPRPVSSCVIIWHSLTLECGEGNGTPLQYSCLENPMDGGAWWATVRGVAQSRTQLSNFTFTFHFHALEKEMATHSSVLAWRIPGTGEPSGLPSMGSHRVGHDWSDLAAAAAAEAFRMLNYLIQQYNTSPLLFNYLCDL